jgi:hypothetical protein
MTLAENHQPPPSTLLLFFLSISFQTRRNVMGRPKGLHLLLLFFFCCFPAKTNIFLRTHK